MIDGNSPTLAAQQDADIRYVNSPTKINVVFMAERISQEEMKREKQGKFLFKI